MVRPSTFPIKHVCRHVVTLKPVDYSYRSDIGLNSILAGLRAERAMVILAQAAPAPEIYSSVLCDVQATLATGRRCPGDAACFLMLEWPVTIVSNIESDRSDVLQAI